MDMSFTFQEKVMFGLRSLYRSYGYTQYKMSKFEEYDLYAKNKDFLISDGVITFTDTNGKLMALKPDVTLSIIKNKRVRSIPISHSLILFSFLNQLYSVNRNLFSITSMRFKFNLPVNKSK